MIKFEWGAVKAASNIKKHGIYFKEAKSVFFDEFAMQFFDHEKLLKRKNNSWPSLRDYSQPLSSRLAKRLSRQY